MIRYVIACALLAVPANALAQTNAAQAPVVVEIVASGEVTVPAQKFRTSLKIVSKGETEDAAKAKLAADKARLLRSLAPLGVREAQPGESSGGNPLMSLFAGMGGLSKPTISMEALIDDPDAKPEATATETVQLDAPTRAALVDARKIAEEGGATLDEDALGLLDDYPAASRRAKADALVKARAQALSYGEALGLRQAAIVRISEKQDIVQGSIGFVSQIFGMFAPKTGAASNDVTVRETLTVEFKLGK